jgi:hypothetical protein
LGKRYDLLIKAIAAEIGVPHEFRRTGGSVNDFLRNRLLPDDDAETVGARILDYFCLNEDREFNGIMNGVKLALAFLDEVLPARDPPQTETALKDLRDVLHSRPTFQQICCWVRATYR